jgi:hypothetical protein
MSLTGAFYPQANTVNVAVTGTSANVQFTTGIGLLNGCQVRLFNSGTNITYINFGATSAVTATTTAGLAMAPNSIEVFTVPYSTTYVAAIGTSGNTLYATPGEGV